MPAISATIASGLSPSFVADVGAGADAHAVVVTEDRGACGERAREHAVDVDDRDAGLHRLDRDLGQRGAVGGQQHDRVDALVDEGLDGGDLRDRVVRALRDLQVDVTEAVGSGLSTGVDGAEPAVVGGGAREADDDGVALLGVLLGGGALVDDVVLVGSRAGAAGEQSDGCDDRGAGQNQSRARLQV